MKWQPIETHAKDDKPVLIYYKNCNALGRTIKAFYADKFKIEADCDDECEHDYCEKEDRYYMAQGWYEMIDNWGDFSCVFVCEGVPSHWMPLPAPPEKEPA